MSEKILLIFEFVPEERKPYIIDADSGIGRTAIASAGQYINSVDTPDDAPVHQLSEMLEGMQSIDPKKPITGPFSAVVICGFIM